VRHRDVGGVPLFRVSVEARPFSGASGLVGDPEARDWRPSLGVRRLGCGRCSLNTGRTNRCLWAKVLCHSGLRCGGRNGTLLLGCVELPV
jgi:hypothetical protein